MMAVQETNQSNIWNHYKATILAAIGSQHSDNRSWSLDENVVSLGEYYDYIIDSPECRILFGSTEENTEDVDSRLLNYHHNISQLYYFRAYYYDTDEIEDVDTTLKPSEYYGLVELIVDAIDIHREEFLAYRNAKETVKESHKTNSSGILGLLSKLLRSNPEKAEVQTPSCEKALHQGSIRETVLWGGEVVNLFEEMQKPNPTVFHMILYLSLIEYRRKYSSEYLGDFSRVVRNYLASERVLNERAFCYRSTLHINELKIYWRRIEALMADASVYDVLTRGEDLPSELKHEKEKAELYKTLSDDLKPYLQRLEDHRFLKGHLRLLGLTERNVDSRILEYANAIENIWDGSNDNSFISRALIASGFQGVSMEPMAGMDINGKLYGADAWDVILTNKKADVYGFEDTSFLTKFLDSYIRNDYNLDVVVEKAKKDFYTSDDWTPLFLRYDTFTRWSDDHLLFYYNWKKLSRLSTDLSGASFSSPFVEAIVEELKKMNRADISEQDDLFKAMYIYSDWRDDWEERLDAGKNPIIRKGWDIKFGHEEHKKEVIKRALKGEEISYEVLDNSIRVGVWAVSELVDMGVKLAIALYDALTDA